MLFFRLLLLGRRQMASQKLHVLIRVLFVLCTRRTFWLLVCPCLRRTRTYILMHVRTVALRLQNWRPRKTDDDMMTHTWRQKHDRAPRCHRYSKTASIETKRAISVIYSTFISSNDARHWRESNRGITVAHTTVERVAAVRWTSSIFVFGKAVSFLTE